MITLDFNMDDIDWASGKQLYQWWLDHRVKDKPFALKDDFNPREFSAFLPFLIIIDISLNADNNFEFHLRLLGSNVNELLSGNVIGRNILDIPGGAAMYQRHKIIVTHETPLLAKDIAVEIPEQTHKSYNVIFVPLSSDGRQITQIMAALNFIPRQ